MININIEQITRPLWPPPQASRTHAGGSGAGHSGGSAGHAGSGGGGLYKHAQLAVK